MYLEVAELEPALVYELVEVFVALEENKESEKQMPMRTSQSLMPLHLRSSQFLQRRDWASEWVYSLALELARHT